MSIRYLPFGYDNQYFKIEQGHLYAKIEKGEYKLVEYNYEKNLANGKPEGIELLL